MNHLSFGERTIVSGIIAVLSPILIFIFYHELQKTIKKVTIVYKILLFTYFVIILYFTILSKTKLPERQVKLIPFWSYVRFDAYYVRWQVYMNIFLFIPFGFIISLSFKKSLLQTFIIGCCLSITIEALQYIFSIGLCEFDDIFHNTLGCIIGYLYCIGLNHIYMKRENLIKTKCN